jgi:hypothetical protein
VFTFVVVILNAINTELLKLFQTGLHIPDENSRLKILMEPVVVHINNLGEYKLDLINTASLALTS